MFRQLEHLIYRVFERIDQWLERPAAVDRPAAVNQPAAVGRPQDLAFLDEVAGVEPSQFAGKLCELARTPIQNRDALSLLILAEHAMLAGERQAAAQLFAWMMFNSFDDRYTADNAATTLVDHANEIILLTTGERKEVKSQTELLLYGHRRLVAALQLDGMRQPHLGEWGITAFGRLLEKFPNRQAAMETAAKKLHPNERTIAKHFQVEIGPARNTLRGALQTTANAQNMARVRVPNAGRARPYLLIGSLSILTLIAFGCRNWFSFPAVSFFLDNATWTGSWLSTALLAWPFLLVATWLFALLESLRTRTFYFISPWHLVGTGGIVAGDIAPFTRDLFFHIFQTVWIALVVIAWLLFKDYQALPDWLGSAKPIANAELQGFMTLLARAKLGSDGVALVAAILACALAIKHQVNVQTHRESGGADAYWWDRRIGTSEWWVRLFMVGLDVSLAAFVVVKMLLTLLVAYDLVAWHDLSISYFSPDGVGGLKPLTDMLMHLSWAVFLFGMFVFASLLLHWNLRDYRVIDFGLVIAYVVILVLAVVPLGSLDLKLSAQGDKQVEDLAKTGNSPGVTLADTATYIKNVDLVRNWPVSALNIGILGNPVLPLGFQFLVVIVQFLVRTGKLPKLPIPGLSAQANGEGP